MGVDGWRAYVFSVLSLLRGAGYPEVVFLLLNAGLSATQKDAFAQVSSVGLS